jgi:hypothetical protein
LILLIFVEIEGGSGLFGHPIGEFFTSTGMMRVPYPPYSPDLAPCDFFLFGDIKERLKEQSFDDLDQLFMTINEVCASIEEVILEKAFYEWGERLAKYVVVCGGMVGNT